MFRRLKQIRRLENSKLADDEYYKVDENGRGIIDVGAENYDDIFSYYDLNGENVLDAEFSEFLDKKANVIPQKVELALHFHVKNANEQKCEEIDTVVKNHYKRELKAVNRQLQRNAKNTLYLLIMGLIALGIYVALYLTDAYFLATYIFDLVAWVFLWEVVDNHFIVRKHLQDKRLQMYRFVRADINVYEYISKKEKINKRKGK